MTHLIHVNPLLFEPGDRMKREEFLSRWERMDGLKFAELIDGVVYMPSPLSLQHGDRDMQMHALLGVYAMRVGVCKALSNTTWLMLDSAPQPDIAMALLPQFGGTVNLTGKLASGVPELVVEVCLSSRSYDVGPKLALYQRAGVKEYITVLLEEQRIEWRALENGSYRLTQPDPSGIYRSTIFPGLWLDEPALWKGDGQRLLDVLESGIASDECVGFRNRAALQ
jgi:hypothetical protein